jgi:hypothetical protein
MYITKLNRAEPQLPEPSASANMLTVPQGVIEELPRYLFREFTAESADRMRLLITASKLTLRNALLHAKSMLMPVKRW